MKRYVVFGLTLCAVALANQLSSQEKGGLPGIVVDKNAKTVTIDAFMAPRVILKEKKEPYPLEVIATWPHPKGKKAHETIVNFSDAVKPSDVHKALESLGLTAGKPIKGEGEPKGPALNVYFLIPDSTSLERKVTLDRAMVDSKNGKPFPKNIEWRFTGSTQVQPDPNKNEKIYGADFSGTLMTIFPVTDETVFQTELTIKQEGIMKLEVNTKVMPKEGTRVKLVVEVKK
jgi:hypothetical protein